MYEDLFHFFGLREDPFHVSPDPRFYFATHSHNSALAELTAGIESRRGLFVLTGEAGTGKTTLVRHFLDWLEARHQSSCYIFHSQLRPMELLELILQDFGIACFSQDKHDIVVALNKWLLERRRMGDAPVLVIDEAQTSPLRTLRRLNVLLNLELNGCKLLQVVLAGQPELDEKLQRPELWQLQQRIIFRTRLMPLSTEETAEYVRSRLQRGGAKEEVFCEEALQEVHMNARGIPRVVNLLCEHALIAAYSEKAKPIPAKIVREVATNFDLNVQTGMKTEEEARPRLERAVPVRPEDISATALRRDTAVAEEMIEEVNRNAPVRTPSKWPIHLPKVEEPTTAAQQVTADKIAANVEVESKTQLVRPAETTVKFPEVFAAAAGNATIVTDRSAGGASLQAATLAANSTAVGTKIPSTTAATRALEAASVPEVAPAPIVMAAATTLSPAPTLASPPVKQPVPAAPVPIKSAAEKPAKAAALTETTEAEIARAMVVAKPRAPKPALVKPIKRVVPRIAKPKRLPVNWKGPGLLEQCIDYCRAVAKSFVADWKHFMQAPIQARKQTGVGTGND